MRVKSTITAGYIYNGVYGFRNKAGLIGNVNFDKLNLWKITNCLAMGDASKNAEDGSPEESYKFLGRDVSTYTTNNISNCYELATVGGPTKYKRGNYSSENINVDIRQSQSRFLYKSVEAFE